MSIFSGRNESRVRAKTQKRRRFKPVRKQLGKQAKCYCQQAPKGEFNYQYFTVLIQLQT